jgi:hypothetical protein
LIRGFRDSDKFGFKYHTDLFKNEQGVIIPIKRPRIEVVFRKYSERTDPDTNPEFRAFALVDSGSDVCYLPKQIADILKLERNEENKKESVGVGKKIWTYRTKVYLEILNKGRRIGVDMVEVAFPEQDPEGIELDINILLGRRGLFSNYEITFNDQSQFIGFRRIKKDNPKFDRTQK